MRVGRFNLLFLYILTVTFAKLYILQIADLSRKMEDMSQEFGEMLKETLDKMSEKIEATSNDWEQGSGSNSEKKLAELRAA